MNDDTPNRHALEQQLLREPFNAAARRAYAALLLAEGAAAEALQQTDLLCQQDPRDAAAHVLAACAQLALTEPEAALTRYLQARALPDFEPHETLEVLMAQASPASPAARPGAAPHLQLVGAAGAAARVASIQQVPGDKVRFSSIVGMDELKKTIRLKIIEPYLKPGLFARFRAHSGGGILLYGPPGCGKTMLARAVANECQAEFVSVGIADILNMWMGESERNLAAMFEKARANAPCVLFFDELDALAYARSKAPSSSARTVVNEFLGQLDGVGRDNQGVLVLAATNMPWDVDSAMKRPGRFSRQIFVPPPDAAARREMLQNKLMGLPQEADLDVAAVAQRTAHFSGADIDGLIERATERALADALDGRERGISAADFDAAIAETQASTLDWLRTVRNVVKYAGDDGSYKDVERYLRSEKLM